MSNFDDVGKFHEKFALDNVTHRGPGPRDVDTNPRNSHLIKFRIDFMQEELNEFTEAAVAGNHAKMFDALLDLAYVTFGTAHLLGYPWQEGWDLVQTANITKERVLSADDQRSTRGSIYDVVKPAGWKPPSIEELLRNHGWTIR